MRSLIFYPGIIIKLIFCNFYRIKINRLTKKGDIKARDAYIHKVTTRWAKSVMKLAGARITVVGQENIPKDKTALFVSNHQSNFDIPLLMSSIDVPKGFIAKKELEKWPMISTWMKYINCIFMDRSNLRKSAEAIVQGTKLLKNGYSMVIFPEGTRSKGGPIQDFKAGSFKLATKSGCLIVPVTINGTYKLLEANNNKIKGADVELVIHPPIDPTQLKKEELDNLNEKVCDIVRSSYKKA
ncbi:lysophospholipid acyltransferase family protein [Clostridium sp. SM-530-WT-3G]|uniref:lysophospholipid acyltransferase family protein n=1 Tax=Clostridium sp. SM-530-WT-3G TaxID=2725303 RepID=UPI00145F6214|nr:lysophospholipid acyltransferase family protein [Clostridium sp. SM-530-WT-3G]NME83892.1 1-acyl-sn-glycerol-3-phosphate acyltransferase [Clostridium sp. SM-530-WT-3G]